jgi:serine protease AprX
MNTKRLFQFLVVASLLMAGMGSTPHQALAAKAQPLLTELAAQNPSQMVRVIVQQMAGATGAEALVAKLGGQVTRDLSIINAFVAEMTAETAVKLALSESVRWVSLDAPTRSSDSCEQTMTLNPVADTELDEAEPNVSDGSATSIDTVPSPAGKRAYGAVLFDLSNIPTGSTVTTATLGIYVLTARTSHSDPVHVMTAVWTESATWSKRDGVNTWTSGSFGSNDYAATALGTIVPSTTGFKTLDVTSTVANWVNGSVANRGLLIRSTGTDTGGAGYATHESANNKPYLSVTYMGPCPPPDTGFVTWATAVGTVTPMGFTNGAVIYDSALGPNGTFGYGNKVKGAFGGFTAEVTPGNRISKVELVLKAYISKATTKTIKYQTYINGTKVGEVLPSASIFSSAVGAANANQFDLDITGSRTWQWTDFDNNLQVLIDQSQLGSGEIMYYDAIGLRVTSTPGAAIPGDTSGDSSALATLVTNQQVNVYNQVIRSSELWNTAAKLQGKGVTVAVVDSGVYKTKDLGKRVRVNANFNNSYHDATDRFGHGTFVAGIIAGSGSQSGNKYMGVAPRADLLNVRVSDDQGMSYESDVVAALQWVYENKAKYNIRVVNLSLNSSVEQSYHTSPLDAACEILWFNGIVVVASAGNNGTATLFPPANDPFVITVGATDDKGTLSTADDTIATFSASGVTESGFAKPDLVSPGRLVIGLLPENDKLRIGQDHPSNRVDTTYFKMSGTSVSAPMVSGAIALLLQDEPNLTPDQVKYRLMATANKNWSGYNVTTSGAGYLDIYSAVYGTTTQSANTGLLPSLLLATGENAVDFASVGWNSVGWNSVGWNSVGWNSVGWNSVGWNSVGWNSDYWGP